MTQTVATDPTVTVTADVPERCDRCGSFVGHADRIDEAGTDRLEVEG